MITNDNCLNILMTCQRFRFNSGCEQKRQKDTWAGEEYNCKDDANKYNRKKM